jgi:CHASE3 domain sensor protein
MTDVTSFTPSDAKAALDGAKDTAADTTKRAKEAVSKAVKSARETATEVAHQTRTFAAEKAKVGAAWTSEKAKVAHHAAEEHPIGVAVGAFAIGLGVGFLIARNLD